MAGFHAELQGGDGISLDGKTVISYKRKQSDGSVVVEMRLQPGTRIDLTEAGRQTVGMTIEHRKGVRGKIGVIAPREVQIARVHRETVA